MRGFVHASEANGSSSLPPPACPFEGTLWQGIICQSSLKADPHWIRQAQNASCYLLWVLSLCVRVGLFPWSHQAWGKTTASRLQPPAFPSSRNLSLHPRCRVLRQLGRISQIKFPLYLFAIVFNRLDAQVQFIGNFARLLPLADELENF